MKKWMVVPILIGILQAATACGNAQSSNASATATTGLTLEGQLLVGTIRLESTDLAVSAAQADQLLPLWETLQSLASSGTAAQQEIDAVVSQIESTMTAEQISSITAMNLTQQDLVAAAADAGASETASSTTQVSSSNAPQFQGGAGAPGAGSPPADMGAGMAAPMDAQTTGGAQAGTAQSTSSQINGESSQISPAMINALVTMLKNKVG